MAIKLEKLGIIIPNNTCAAKRVFRYEVPLLRFMWRRYLDEGTRITQERIPDRLGEAKYGYANSMQDEYERLSLQYASFGKNRIPLFDSVYPTMEDFKEVWDIAIERDIVEDGTEAPLEYHKSTQTQADLDTTAGSELEEIKGVGRDLAIRLTKAGFPTLKHVAMSDLDELESVEGLGPVSASKVRKNANAILNMVAQHTDESDDA